MSNYYGKRKRGRHSVPNKEEVAEDWCFVCKDGGDLLICDYKQCMKAYHPECAGKAGNVLETGKRWNCEWHYCLICNKSSTYRCFVCTNAVCRKCIKLAEFVQVRGKHGFCNDCLYRALLYEENVDVDSDGRKVDFKDRNTYECLFNEYWEIIKEKEGLTSEDVRSANILLKKGECFRGKMDSDKCFNGEEEDQDFDDVEPCSLMENETKWLPPRKHAKKGKQKRREFMGWGSKSLIEFLKSIGKDSINPITQHDVRDIILKYIGENKLTHPEKKKKVLCDIKLQSIFRRKSINKNKIYDLLERHFKENMEESEKDDYSCNSDEKDEDTIVTCKRQTRTSFRRTKDEKEIVLETPRSCFASVTEHNIKLIYLKRTLIEDFLMTPETFDDKVIGSFVRVKSNPNDCFQKSVYQLLQVTGITKAQGTENITGEVTLQLSNMKEDTPICMLSDDNFLEEEIEELHQRVKNGLLKRLAIVELEQKARRLHEDLTEHWIKKELILLQNLIDQANEKGWRREKDLLQTPSEKQRLLQEIPKVIAEEIEIEVNPLDLPKDENPTKDNSPRAILLTRDSVSADDIAGTDDAIIVDADVKVTLCKEVNGDDTDNRTDESVAEGTEAAITVNAQVTPELSVIELSGDQANKSATESTSGTEDAIIGNADIELMPHISVIEVNVDDSDKRAAEKLAKGVEDAFSVNSNSEVMPDSSMIEVNGGDSDKKAAEKILEGNGAAGYKSSEQEKNGKHLHVNVERNEEAQVILDENEQVDGTLNAGEHLQIQVKAERNEVAQVILDESEHIKETLSTEASHAELIQVNVEKNEEAQVILDENEQVDGTLNARKHRQIQVKVERNEEAQVILDESEHETLSREAYRAELILVNVERNEEAQVILDENEQVDGILNAGKHQQVQVEVERIEEAQVILDESECDEETLRTEASHAELIQVKVECNEEAQVILDENELLDGTLNAGNHQQIQVKVERNEEAQVILDESEHVKETLSTNAGKHHQIQVKVERIEEAQVILDESECDEETLSTEASHAELIQVKVESNEEAQVILDENEQLDGTLNAGNHQQIQVKVERNEETQVILDESEHVKETLSTKASHAEIIDLDDDENPYSKIWHYMNLDQETFGPFMMSQLRKWWDKKFFPTDIQVWKTDQTKEEAIFLKDALRRLFPDYREKEDVLL